MKPAVAIVGMACRYPDAKSPDELWQNVLARRRAFRRLPAERLRLQDYHSPDPKAPDRTYASQAAVIENYEFDRVAFRVAGSTFRSADLTHWLALDVASQALADAGFAGADNCPRESTGVVLGNTLTGEFSRANVMRLRWPYVRRVVDAALADEGRSPDERRDWLERLEAVYKRPFPPIGEETLAGGLSNTIAGRICNHFDFKGGGYTVDGACSASLLAVINACTAIVAGDLDVALAGGVDLSLDPFELIGFAKTGALAPERMRVYDARSAGFWPGEGCGFVVLMPHAKALAEKRRIYAVIRGWGVSSDGSGGITRPEVEGQMFALRRAYARAGFGIDTIAYFEGHGTGTSVGDATELRTLSQARRESNGATVPAAIGTIKANIGHTKAAAGIAGVIKATMAVHRQTLPPTTGCESPHPELLGDAPALRVLDAGEPWPSDQPLRAAISAMGFGGINTHLVLAGAAQRRRRTLPKPERNILASDQDAELFLFAAPDSARLADQLQRVRSLAEHLSQAELVDLSARLAENIENAWPLRAGVVASDQEELCRKLDTLSDWMTDGKTARIDVDDACFLGSADATPQIGYLFPGQGSPAHLSGGMLRRRFDTVQKLYRRAALPSAGDGISTDVAQPAIVTASAGALQVLTALGVGAEVAVGHSLGELAAYHWAGVFDATALLRIAAARGRAMAELPGPTGAMAGIAADADVVAMLVGSQPVVLAGLNSPKQTVVSGEADAIDAVVAEARQRGLRAVRLPVSHAFHSQLVAEATPALALQLQQERFRRPNRRVVSTVTGEPLPADADLKATLCTQVTAPVRFADAVRLAADGLDMLIEVGPGEVLTGLARELSPMPCVALDAGGDSIRGLLTAAAAAFALGANLRAQRLFAGRLVRPIDLERPPRFFANPCESAPLPEGSETSTVAIAAAIENDFAADEEPFSPPVSDEAPTSALETVRQLVAQRVELPPSAVHDDSRLLSDLHLNSITVGRLVTESARRLGLPVPLAPTEFADATVAQVAQALQEGELSAGALTTDREARFPPGIDTWMRMFTVERVARHRVASTQIPSSSGSWTVVAPTNDPFAAALTESLHARGGDGVAVCLAAESEFETIECLLTAARALETEGCTRFVLVHNGEGGAFARTLHLERPDVDVCVVDVPRAHPQAADWVADEALAASGFADVQYDASGRRLESVWRLLPDVPQREALPLGPDDVVLASGGGKGIGAECALSLAHESGARLVLLGRSQPENDEELAANLDRMAAAGVRARYVCVDITDTAGVRRELERVQREVGPISGVLHAAGANVPQRIESLDAEAFARTLAPKVQGLTNILAATDPDRLRVLVTFGSIISRAGLPGEADYGLANEWLRRLTESWSDAHPHCRCLAVEWSVWSGVGMGERLGRIDSLMRNGVAPISPDRGVQCLHDLLSRPDAPVSVVVAGRFGQPPTVELEVPALPLRRFVEKPRVHYPGVELIVDADLSADTDPYLSDHVMHGERVLPAVMGMEAMAQVAQTVTGSQAGVIFENVEFTRPILIADAPTTIRLATLVQAKDRVEVALRTDSTQFQVDHFRAVCRIVADGVERDADATIDLSDPHRNGAHVAIQPERDLYGDLLFHTGRFRRLRGYRRLRAVECLGEIAPATSAPWFSSFLPSELVLGDPAVRDTALHAVQACIPHARVLPVGADRIVTGSLPSDATLWVHARERSRSDDTFVYDLVIASGDGKVLERWEGLRLQRIEPLQPRGGWTPSLLGPYVERRVGELLPRARLAVAVERNGQHPPDDAGRQALQIALGEPVAVFHRPDGKPHTLNGRGVSIAHADDLTLAVAASGPIGCDIEPVAARSESEWSDLLGPERFGLAQLLARENPETTGNAATRVWAAAECIRKTGGAADTPLTFASSLPDGWVLLRAGSLTAATLVATLRDTDHSIVLAVLVGNDDAGV